MLGRRRRASELLRTAAVQTGRRNLHGPAGVLVEAADADPFGNCQVEDDLIHAPRACADIQAALATTETAARERPADTLLNAVYLPARRAAVELRRDRAANAVKLLEAAAPFDRGYPEAMYLRGLAYLQTGNSVAAANEFQKIIDQKGASWGARYPQAYVGLARAAAQAGDTARATEAYRDFLALWKDADEDLALLLEATKEYAALR